MLSHFRVALEIVRRTVAQASLFAQVDAFGRATKARVGAETDFNEYHCICIKHDEIDLAATRAHISCYQTQTPVNEILARESFGCGTFALAATTQQRIDQLLHDYSLASNGTGRPPRNRTQVSWR